MFETHGIGQTRRSLKHYLVTVICIQVCVVLFVTVKYESNILWICAEKTYDYSKLDFKKLKVSELKNILSEWGEQCRGCTEKSDYIRLVEELLPKHAPDAAKARSPGEL